MQILLDLDIYLKILDGHCNYFHINIDKIKINKGDYQIYYCNNEYKIHLNYLIDLN
jgi:hypothetical protein